MQPESQLSDAVLRQALDAAPDGIAVVDETGAIVFVNPMVEQLFDYPREELVGMSVDLLLPEKSRGVHAGRRAEYAAHPRTRSMGTGLALRGRRRSSAEFPLEISLSPLRMGERLFVIAVIRDVTERRAADEELQRAREELALVDDRERIARDLHDTVIQRLFAVGLSLYSARVRTTSPRTTGRRVPRQRRRDRVVMCQHCSGQGSSMPLIRHSVCSGVCAGEHVGIDDVDG